MMNETELHHSEKPSLFQCIILVLSIYVLGAVFVQTTVTLSPGTNLLLDYIDSVICVVFLFDFFYHLFTAPSKKKFLKWGWIDLVSSIPMVGVFRWGRIARVVRILRLLRAFRSSKILITYLFQHRANSTFATVSLISFVLVIFSSIAILHVETEANSNIKSPADALWWAFTTITTVGYGDKYPITTEGRAVAVVLMISGVGLFATFTGYLSSFFLEPAHKKSEADLKELIEEVRSLRLKVESLDNQFRQTADAKTRERKESVINSNSRSV